MIGRCGACNAKDRVIALLEKQVEERDRTLLAMTDPAAYKARFPAPPAPPAPEAAPVQPPGLTRDQLRNVEYTLPHGETPQQAAQRVEEEFLLEGVYGGDPGGAS